MKTGMFKYLFFKDKAIYEKSKTSIMATTYFQKSLSGKIIVEITNPNSGYYHSLLPLESEFAKMEEIIKLKNTSNNLIESQIIEYYQKIYTHYLPFRKTQKRKEFTEAEFNQTFDVQHGINPN